MNEGIRILVLFSSMSTWIPSNVHMYLTLFILYKYSVPNGHFSHPDTQDRLLLE